ncbi:uncharacterized protein [Penaeus vannamei]|uniref:uncharacterized protein isoform X2 n=1 Tax=Penaeus vannamei TaxID=6689 RepID=UPI00387F50CA
MAAALLPGLLLLALSLGFPLASADMKTLPLDLPSTMFLKPRQSSTRVTFKVLFQNTTDQEASFPLDNQWYKVELFRNDAQNVVLRVSSYPDKEFTCCAGQKLLNHHASYEGLADWSEECPDEVPKGSLFSCPGMESTTAERLATKAPSTQDPDAKAPSEASSQESSSSTEDPVGVSVLLFALAVAGMLLLL